MTWRDGDAHDAALDWAKDFAFIPCAKSETLALRYICLIRMYSTRISLAHRLSSTSLHTLLLYIRFLNSMHFLSSFNPAYLRRQAGAVCVCGSPAAPKNGIVRRDQESQNDEERSIKEKVVIQIESRISSSGSGYIGRRNLRA